MHSGESLSKSTTDIEAVAACLHGARCVQPASGCMKGAQN